MTSSYLLLGRLEVTRDGRPLRLGRRRERCLLGTLLLEAERPVTVDRLLDLLWDGEPPPSARASLRSHIARLRACLHDASGSPAGLRLRGGDGGYRAEVDRELVDVHRFRAMIDRAGRIAEPAARARTLRDALAMWRGPVLEADASDRLRSRIGADLGELRMTATEQMVEAELACGRARQLVGELAALTAEHPYRERFAAQHMVALHQAGRQAEALEAYRRFRQRLVDDLGVDPGPDLRRLHTAMLRGELDAPPRPAPPARAAYVPAQLPAGVHGFTGRGAELAALDTLLAAADRPGAAVVTALTGMAGVGKTALALHWAHRVADQFPDGQLYVNLRGFDPGGRVMDPAEALRGFLDALGVPPERLPSTMDAQAALYRSRLAGKRVLVVLDNARDADQTRPLLPGTRTAVAVVTSRDRLTPLVAIDGAQPIALDVMSTGESRALLANRLGAERTAAEPDAVEAVIAACARLPLALVITAARARQMGFPLSGLAAVLTGEGGAVRLDTLDAGDRSSQVRAVFSWSYQALEPAAARLFRLLALHCGPDVSVPAAACLAGLPAAGARRLLADLAGANLLAERTPGRYAFHDLLRAYAADLTRAHDPAAERRAAIARMLDHYLHTAYAADRLLYSYRDPIALDPVQAGVTVDVLADRRTALAWLSAEHEVLCAVVKLALDEGFDVHSWQLALVLTEYLHRRGHWHDWVATQHVALDAARHLADPALQGFAHRTLSRAYARLGRYGDADTHLHHALDLFGESGDPVDRAHTHRGLGWILERRGRHGQALTHLTRALDLFRGAGHRIGQANTLNAIGWHHAQQGRHHQAVEYCQQALGLQRAAGDRHGEAATLDSLGYAHHHLADYARAADCYHRALALRRDLGDRYDEAGTLVHLGDNHHAVGARDAARAAWRQALEILADLGHPDADAVRARLRDRPVGREPDHAAGQKAT